MSAGPSRGHCCDLCINECDFTRGYSGKDSLPPLSWFQLQGAVNKGTNPQGGNKLIHQFRAYSSKETFKGEV